MITRGIKYYNITDIKKHVFHTIDAKRLENAIIDEEIDFSQERLLSPLVTQMTTKHLNLFLGDLLIQLIPKEVVHLFFQYKEFKRMSENSLMSNVEVRERVAELEDRLMDFDADNVMMTNSYIVIYQLQSDGKKQLDTVGTILPIKIERFFSDERAYLVDDGLPIFSNDGIPEGLNYYKDESGEIIYTNKLDRGRQIGT